MNTVLKVVASFGNGVLGGIIWLYTLLTGAAVVEGLAVIISSTRHFSRSSRASMFDIMQMQATVANPLQGRNIDSGLFTLLMVVALVIGTGILVGGVRPKCLKKSFGVNLMALAASIAAAILVSAAARWLLGNDVAGAMKVLFIGVAVAAGIKFSGSLLLREPQEELIEEMTP